ncbi:MAG: hypothetical protein JWN96_1187 [Mycobacterium sp.]|nr:hypothetical protein [Mycobacterium sp.]
MADYDGAWEDRGGSLVGSAPAVGKHFTSVQFTFTNASNSELDSARTHLFLIDTQDRLYSPNIDVIPGCVSIQEWGFTLQPGQTATRCAVFQIPDSVSVSMVRFGATEDSSGQVVTLAEWTTL